MGGVSPYLLWFTHDEATFKWFKYFEPFKENYLMGGGACQREGITGYDEEKTFGKSY